MQVEVCQRVVSFEQVRSENWWLDRSLSERLGQPAKTHNNLTRLGVFSVRLIVAGFVFVAVSCSSDENGDTPVADDVGEVSVDAAPDLQADGEVLEDVSEVEPYSIELFDDIRINSVGDVSWGSVQPWRDDCDGLALPCVRLCSCRRSVGCGRCLCRTAFPRCEAGSSTDGNRRSWRARRRRV